MYDPSPDPATLSQGDILRGVPLVQPSDPLLLLVDDESGENLEAVIPGTDLSALGGERRAVVAEATIGYAAIVTQTCDLCRKEFATLAAVTPVPDEWGASATKEAKRWDRRLNLFFLDACGPMPPSLVNFELLFTMRRDRLHELRSQRVASLTPEYGYCFQYKLGQFFARPAME